MISSDLENFSHHDLVCTKSESDACRENSRNLRLSVLRKFYLIVNNLANGVQLFIMQPLHKHVENMAKSVQFFIK